MADECDLSKIVTAFLFNTCRLRPWISRHDVQAALFCGFIANLHPADDEEAGEIPLITGSAAEFYIQPMLPHIGDVDLMCYPNTLLAIPRGHPPPTQLPAEFHNYVKVGEIIDSHLPGYVYLEFRYLLTQCIDEEKYQYFEHDNSDERRWFYWSYKDYSRPAYDWLRQAVHGPAWCFNFGHIRILLSADKVNCVRCLCWPPQAADWPTRHRNYGWPDSATLDRVVSNGCDVVQVAHRLCRQDEWMNKHQWRLSFSRAEILLINNWMPVQQITYHILRLYLKTERLTESADNSEPAIMSNYHIKTLMLWACELKPRSWWTENLNLVKICVELLNTLSVWLTDTRCPHYFISNCNLLDNSLNVGSVASKLMSIDEKYLSTWLINRYIGQCARLCPVDISRLFDDVSRPTSRNLQKAVSEIVRWRVNTSLSDMWRAVDKSDLYISLAVSVLSLTPRSCVCWMNELTKLYKHFSLYFTGVVLLHVAHKISRNGFSEKLMDILSIILEHNFSQCCNVLSRCKTELNTSELVELLQKSAVEHLTRYRQLMAQDFGSVATIVTTDFEAMYAYKCGDYQRCLQLSTQNVRTLLYARRMLEVPIFRDVSQLLDDDLVSLTALALIVNPQCAFEDVMHVTLSLYLMAQCQLKLRHPVTSLVQTLEYIEIAQREHAAGRYRTLDQLILKLIERKVLMLLRTNYY